MHAPTPPSRPVEQPPATPRPLALVGPGRAGRAVAAALRDAGWPIVGVAGRAADAPSTRAAAAALDAPARDVADVAREAEIVVVATPDASIESVAAAVVPAARPGTLVVHLAGAPGLDTFGAAARVRPDVRFAALHPLVSIPTPDPERLAGGWCAVAGDPDVHDLAAALGMHPFLVAAGERVRYHAAATIAANHLVALMGQVERTAALAGVPREALYPLVRGVLANCDALGPRDALTGPVKRGDVGTVDAHLAALPADDRALYRALAAEALRLSGRDDPDLAARLR